MTVECGGGSAGEVVIGIDDRGFRGKYFEIPGRVVLRACAYFLWGQILMPQNRNSLFLHPTYIPVHIDTQAAALSASDSVARAAKAASLSYSWHVISRGFSLHKE